MCTDMGWFEWDDGEWTDFSGCDKSNDTINMEYFRYVELHSFLFSSAYCRTPETEVSVTV